MIRHLAGLPGLYNQRLPTCNDYWQFSRRRFQMFYIFTPTWGNDTIWLIFFKWVETTTYFTNSRHIHIPFCDNSSRITYGNSCDRLTTRQTECNFQASSVRLELLRDSSLTWTFTALRLIQERCEEAYTCFVYTYCRIMHIYIDISYTFTFNTYLYFLYIYMLYICTTRVKINT